MKKIRLFFWVCFISLCLLSAADAQRSFHAVFLNPDPPGSPFWDSMTGFMKAVSNDLKVELDVLYSDRTRYKNRNNYYEVLGRDKKPDVIITIVHQEVFRPMLEKAASTGVKIFSINTDIPAKTKEEVGSPREKFPHWIGHMVPDDKHGGYQLAEELSSVKNLLPKENSSPFEMIGITGSHESSPALLRKEGVEKALEAHPDIKLKQTVYAYWNEQKAYSITSRLLNRYPDVSFIWCAGGAMTAGTLKAIQESSKTLGQDLFFGTFDWNDMNVKLIKNGSLATSIGGHFMDGGWTIILLYDYYNGHDFEKSTGSTILKSLSVMNSRNVEKYEKLLKPDSWEKIDFKKLTKTHRRKDNTYHLSIDSLIE